MLSFLAIGAVVALVSGCGDLNKGAEERDPNIKRARERRAVADYAGAIEFYERALQKRPSLARIHWEMGSIYDQHLTNELRAIYHYERYLELDPKAERRRLVEELIGAARLSFAASLPARPSEAVQEIARLRQELDKTRQQLAAAREENARLVAAASGRPAPAAASSAAAGAAERPTPTPAAATTLEPYVVQPGDTLSRIAKKVYNDANKWNVIFEANRNILSKPESVRVGQTLMIPR